MEAPSVRSRSKSSQIAFERQPPRLVRWGFHASPYERLMIGLTAEGHLCRIEFARTRDAATVLKEWKKAWPRSVFVEDKKATASIIKELAKIKSAKKSGISLQMTGTPFQHMVWKELMKVPPGTTISYAELARRVKKPKAMRAVGNAMGANPIPIIVPCHRVIASNGGIGGFGGGLSLKRQLLEAEGTKHAA